MAIWMQLGTVGTDDLAEDQANALMNFEDRAGDFVEVIEGDWSKQYEIDLDDIRTADELMTGVESGDVYGYICIDKDIPFPHMTKLADIAEREFDGYWTGTKVYQVDYDI